MQSRNPLIDHRVSVASVLLRSPDDTPLVDTDVVVEQLDHEFGFGNIAFDLVPLAAGEVTDAEEAAALERRGDDFLDIFNTATLPFYWGRFEPKPGQPRTEALRATAKWLADRRVRVKGHPLVWHTVAPPWLLDLDLAETERRLRERIRRDVGDFAGLIDTWDAINEVVIMPVFTAEDNGVTRLAYDRGRMHMLRLAFDEARATNATATLVLNDFDLSTGYECLIEGALDAGIQIDAIGLQTHMHQGFRGEEHLTAIADRFARFGLPLQFTETSLVSGDLMPADIVDLNDYQVDSWPSTPEGEARQADELERHYRTLVAHPAVESITYWGLTDAGAWLGAPIGLLRSDGSRKPSYDALRGLIKGEWWLPPTRARTDGDGALRIEGFRGRYRVSVGAHSAELDLASAPSDLTLSA